VCADPNRVNLVSNSGILAAEEAKALQHARGTFQAKSFPKVYIFSAQLVRIL